VTGMTTRILIADRGVSAVRVARSLVESGYTPIGIYTKEDEGSIHRKYLVEDREVSSYHDIGDIVDAAVEMGAEAVHPGYGFLSENLEFAREVVRNGMIFIGPPPSTLEIAGDRIAVKTVSERVGVPTLPWSEVKKPEDVYEFAKVHGYPLVIRTNRSGDSESFGLVYSDNYVEKVVNSVKKEAKASRRELKLYVEPYLGHVKCIEVQVLGDGDNIIHLYDRECSIQRENRVLVEEAPSPSLKQNERERLLEYALAVANQLKYKSTGVVVFLFDTRSRGIYLSEVKATISAEHAVTEMITRIDIVRKQVEISLYGGLDLRQNSIEPRGFSIGASILAENPLIGGISQGVITKYKEPSGLGIRVDSGVAEGTRLTAKHALLLAKIAAWAPTRILAVSRFKRALDDFVIEGVSTNIPLLKRIIDSEEFTRGEYTLRFLSEKEDYFKELIRDSLEQQLATLVALFELSHSGIKKIFERKISAKETIKSEKIGGLKRSAWYYYTILKHGLSARIRRSTGTRSKSK